MSVSLALLVVVLVARTPSSSAQANGRFWWLNPSAGAQMDSVMPGTIPPVAGVEEEAAPVLPAAAAAASHEDTVPLLAAASEEDAPCVCIDYYLCGPDGYIITTGEGLVDVRNGEFVTGPSCGGLQVCCKPPRKVPAVVVVEPTTTTESSLYPPEECGIRGGDDFANMVDVRIVNEGSRNGSTEFAEFPWMLALLRTNEASSSSQENNMFVCGASLVHPRVAITAAHCVARKKPLELKLRAGEWDTQRKSEPLPHQDRKVTRVVVHPKFYEGTLFNDVALLFLETPFQLARNVRTLCLPQQGDVVEGSLCIATGWGRNAFGREGSYQMIMKMVELPVVTHHECQERLRGTRLSPYFNLHESFVCAGGEKGMDTCQGDGGGPLFCRSARDSGRYVQFGITSWGIGCGDSNVPAVYTNVPLFSDWVTSQLPRPTE